MARKSAWVSTSKAAEALGLSVDYLLTLRKSPDVKPGVHVRNKSRREAARPTYQWHVKKMEALMAKWSTN
jgi:hypothetical protein